MILLQCFREIMILCHMDRMICGLFLRNDENNIFVLRNKEVESLQHIILREAIVRKSL